MSRSGGVSCASSKGRREHLHRTRARSVGSFGPMLIPIYCICPTPTAMACPWAKPTQVASPVAAAASAKNRVAEVAAFRSKSLHSRRPLPQRARHHASDLLDEHSLGPLNSQSLAVKRRSSAPFWQPRAATQGAPAGRRQPKPDGRPAFTRANLSNALS